MGDIINVTPAKDGNSLRDNIKDILRGEIGDLIGETYANTEIVCAMTDSLFSVLDINPDEQDLVSPEIVINPKVRITVKGGVAIADEVTAGIDFLIEDQD